MMNLRYSYSYLPLSEPPAPMGASPTAAELAATGDEALSRLGTPRTRAYMQKTIMGIGSAIIGAFLIIVVLSQVYNLDIIQTQIGVGPFGNLTQDFVEYGTAGLTLVGIGLIIYGASYAMSMFTAWGGGGGR
jgi:hypothetical protein